MQCIFEDVNIDAVQPLFAIYLCINQIIDVDNWHKIFSTLKVNSNCVTKN